MLSSLVLDLMNLLFRVTSKCILTTYKLTQFVSSLSTEGKMYNYFYFALNYTLAYFPRLLLTISIRPSNTAVLGDAENARHENARNAIVWNTACCICMSIAEQECMSRQERAPDFAAVLLWTQDMREVCLIEQRDARLAFVPCGHQRFCASCVAQLEQQARGCPAGLRLPWFCVCTSLTVMTWTIISWCWLSVTNVFLTFTQVVQSVVLSVVLHWLYIHYSILFRVYLPS